MNRNELFFKYKDLVKKALHSIEYPLSLKEDLISTGYELLLILSDRIINNELKKTSDFNIEQYFMYRLKREYVRTIIKYKHHWPGVKKLQIKIEYNTRYIDNNDNKKIKENLLYNNICKKFLKKDIEYVFDKFITKRQKEILKLRYGIDFIRTRTCKEVSEIFKNSVNAINITEHRAMNKIKENCFYLKEYI